MKTIQQEDPHRNIVRQAIGFNELHYDNLIHKCFVTWCETIALRFHHQDRELIKSESLFNYYRQQWNILVERRLINEYRGYLKNDIPNAHDFYYREVCSYVNELENFYPASLLNAPMKSNAKHEINCN